MSVWSTRTSLEPDVHLACLLGDSLLGFIQGHISKTFPAFVNAKTVFLSKRLQVHNKNVSQH